jgi:hypothetical protein
MVDGATSDEALRVVLVVALVAAAGVLAGIFLSNAGKRRGVRRGAEFSEVRAVALEDLRALGDDLRNLDVDLQAAAHENPEAVNQHTRAYEYLEQAAVAFDRAADPEDLAAVSSALESGRFAMNASRTLFERGEAPRRRPPCFFDTRHGPSVDDVGWMPPDGPPRPVPACADCRQKVANFLQPPARRVRTGGRLVPFYDAPPHFESWFGGYFGRAAADLVAGFPLGHALDDGFAGGRRSSGGGYGYLPLSFADTGILDSGGADTGERAWEPGSVTIQEDPDEDQSGGGR